jgi:Ca2+-binding RTX toxin-like protein
VASTLAVDAGGTLRFTAARGEVNHVAATDLPVDARTMVVTDPGSVIRVGAGCSSVTVHEARCPSDPLVAQPLAIDLRDGDDSATAFKFAFGAIEISGGAGDDTIGDFPQSGAVVDGGAGADTINVRPNFGGIVDVHGRAGDDHITATGARGSVDGDAGDDRIDLQTFVNPIGGVPGSSVTGGAGEDTITAGGASFFATADGGMGSDTVISQPGAVIAHVIGGAGGDTIRASASSPAATAVDAGAGPDTVDGGGGGDTIDCGAGADRYVVYAGDAVTRCETPFTPIVPPTALGARA